MESGKVKIIGISGTPVKGGNCDRLVQKALEAAREIEGVETEFISLADKKIAACTNCQWCIENRSRCKVKDDLHEVHDRMFEADGLILGGPTCNQVLSTQLINVFSRGREEIFFAHRLANKGIPGSAVTLGWFGMGMETALHNIYNLMESWGVFPVASGSAISSTAWKGLKADYSPNGVLDDLRGGIPGPGAVRPPAGQDSEDDEARQGWRLERSLRRGPEGQEANMASRDAARSRS